MSDENEDLIEKTFITQLGAKYPMVKAKGCNEAYGINAFPTLVIIGPDGMVHSQGHPSDSVIEELLKGVIMPPKIPDGAQFDPLRQMWKKHEYAKLRDYLDKLLPQPNLEAALREVYQASRDALTRHNEANAARAERLGQGPDYAAAEIALEKIVKLWKGFPAAEAAQKELTRFAGDAKIKKEVSSGKALAKVLGSFDAGKVSQRKKLIEALAGFAKKHEGTEAGKQAQEHLNRLQGQR